MRLNLQGNVMIGLRRLVASWFNVCARLSRFESWTLLRMWPVRTGRFMLALVGLLALAVGETHAQRESASPGPRLHKSKTFQIYTDLPARQAEELVDRLESMIRLVAGYFGRPCRKTIRMYVVDDLKHWTAEDLAKLSPEGLDSIRDEGGVTVTRVTAVRGGPRLDADAIVYASARHGTPMHEAIHAYCGLTFGSIGPVWYAEGLAELGKYWRENDSSVNASPYVIEYLKSTSPKPLQAVINNPLERTGDSWQNYAWRWAVCHLLSTNLNYKQRFKPLGIALMTSQTASFEKVYGSQFDEIEYEYRMFLQNLEPGYRCDLNSWDWKARFRPLTGSASAQIRIKAGYGWQPSRALVRTGTTYAVSAEGTWTLGDGTSVSADGDETGRGRLIGAIFKDYQLGKPFDIGNAETWTAPGDGQLFLRCQDAWGRIDENQGTVTVRISPHSG